MRFAAAVVFVEDVPATMDFYERSFGFARKFYDPEYGYGELETGSATLAVGSHSCADFVTRGAYQRLSGGSSVEIAFTMADVEPAFRKAVEEGAEAVTEPWSPPWGGTIAYVRAPEGTLIGLATPLDG